MRRDLDARHEIAGLDDRTVELGEYLERVEAIDPRQRPDPDVEHAVVGRPKVDPALDGAARLQALSGNRESELKRCVVLVQLARVEQQDRGATGGELGPVLIQVSLGQPPALRPAPAADHDVGRQDRPDQLIRRSTTSDDPRESHAPWGEPGLSGRERPRWPASCRPRPSPRDTWRLRGCRC